MFNNLRKTLTFVPAAALVATQAGILTMVYNDFRKNYRQQAQETKPAVKTDTECNTRFMFPHK